MFPCDDELYVSSSEDSEMNDREHHGHEHQEGVDYCTPFCVCAFSLDLRSSPELADQSIINIDANPDFVYIVPVSLESTNNVFQPPQYFA